MEYSRFLTPMARLRRPSPIRSIIPLLRIPGMISLGAGTPNASLFPFTSLQVEVRDPLDNGSEQLKLSKQELEVALQYSPTQGLPQLVSALQQLQNDEHEVGFGGDQKKVELLVTTGSQDGLCRAFEMLLQPGDSLVLENPSYSGALNYLEPYQLKMIPVETDEFGMIPENLRKSLELAQKRPKVLYVIPTAQNPSGTTMSLKRKRDIYKIAQEFDLIVLEDDPYYFLNPDRRANSSFLSIDVDGRVLRFDSFSKVLSSGMRIGWVSGPPALVNCINLHMQGSVLHSSGDFMTTWRREFVPFTRREGTLPFVWPMSI
eukprot:TRINITY_DN16609_c0_g2_i2.p1 TRINITY_DN16609_c0_g2~~TRINITY_DN16609_c0_g2_i2.p1  ORF type:complete len:317 (-),score=55.73 TRINITY_DN16609_c0_g2_i2:377-1327(-)